MLATLSQRPARWASPPPLERAAVALGLALGLGCAGSEAGAPGADMSLCGGQTVLAALSVADLTGMPGEDDDDDLGDLEDELVAEVAPTLTRQVSRLARRLRDDGQLGQNEWHLGTAPPDDFRYARVDVDDDDEGALDGYRTAAWVPVDAAGRPAGDDVYMVRQGGLAGWRFTAGPFTLPTPDGIELGPEDDGQALHVPPGARVVVRLPQGAAPVPPWTVATGGLKPRHTELAADDQEWVAAYDFTGLPPGTYSLTLEQAGTRAARFDVPVTIDPPDDAFVDGDGW